MVMGLRDHQGDPRAADTGRLDRLERDNAVLRAEVDRLPGDDRRAGALPRGVRGAGCGGVRALTVRPAKRSALPVDVEITVAVAPR